VGEAGQDNPAEHGELTMNPKAVKLNLDPATLLYRAKLFTRGTQDIPRSLVELPSFAWEIPKAKLSRDLDSKSVIRNWMRYFALVTASMAKARKQDVVYVALIQFSDTPERYSISMKCAHLEVIEPLLDPKLREALVDEDVSIQYKFALLDTLCPVVFSCSAADKRVLVTNENHQRDPHQFLDVERCNLTSGMLNFIGSIHMLNAAGLEDEYLGSFSSWIQEAMRLRRDEWLRWFFHLAERNVLFAPGNFRVDPTNPESFVYDYQGK
jgi:hypothetical protein